MGASVYLFIVAISILQDARTQSICTTKACKQTAKRFLQNMDPKVNPCENFYKFACGNFLKTTIIPDDKVTVSSFTMVSDRIDVQLKTIVDSLSRRSKFLPYRKLKLLYDLCMDEEAIENRGVTHAVKLLQDAGGWPVLGDWNEKNWNFLDTEIKLRKLYIASDSIFSIGLREDQKNNKIRVLYVNEPGLGLNREFLINGFNDPTVQGYYSFAVDVAVLFGANRKTAERELRRSVEFEIDLAKIKTSRVEKISRERSYNLFNLEELTANVTWIDWRKLLRNMLPDTVHLRNSQRVIVPNPGYFRRLRGLLQNTPKRAVANYMMWRAVKVMATHLTRKLRNRAQKFDEEFIGIVKLPPRWKICLEVLSSLDVALSSLYVKKYFNKNSKHEAVMIAKNIRKELAKDLKELDWMDKKTRKEAKRKLSNVYEFIGYPDELLDNREVQDFYRNLKLNETHYFEALLDLTKWNVESYLNRLHHSVNRTDWSDHSSLLVVNAFYNPVKNTIEFPAGILQTPFFDADLPKYVNYATLGTIAGHEIIHGFDDSGSQYGPNGNVRNWWDEKSLLNFIKKKQCIIDQYSEFKDETTGLNLDGINTQGESMADQGGLKFANLAYRRLQKRLKKPEPGLPGLQKYSNNQLFFLSIANLWCSTQRSKTLRNQILTGVHPPAEFRVRGLFLNVPDFSESFHCKIDKTQKRCSVW